MFIDTSAISCGVRQGYEIAYDPLDSAFEIGMANYGEPTKLVLDYVVAPYFAMLLFSDIANDRGERLAKFLLDEKLGVVVESPIAENPNTSNKIKTWIFLPNHSYFKKWLWRKVYKDGYRPNPEYGSAELFESIDESVGSLDPSWHL